MSWPIEGQSLLIEADAELLLNLNIEAHAEETLAVLANSLPAGMFVKLFSCPPIIIGIPERRA